MALSRPTPICSSFTMECFGTARIHSGAQRTDGCNFWSRMILRSIHRICRSIGVYAEENELAIIYAGHDATETLGVRALAEHLGERYGVSSSFVSAPTGL